MTQDDLKQKIGHLAACHVQDDMLIGIGTGSTAEAFIHALAMRVRDGLAVKGVATSKRSADLCQKLGIPLVEAEHISMIDLTIDGADELDDDLRLIKGGGGALLREKIIAQASQRVLIIADYTKKVETLGQFPLPVEIVPFGWKQTLLQLDYLFQELNMDAQLTRRGDQSPFLTDNHNFIIDCALGIIADPDQLSYELNAIAGVVDHGLFLGLAHEALIGHKDSSKDIEHIILNF